MKKKKKGSSYIMVVIIMAVIFTVGTSILSVTASDYKMRIYESNRVKSLYSADSGLNLVENIIATASEKAIQYADETVQGLTTLDEQGKKNQFKVEFMRYMTAQVPGSGATNEDLIKYLIGNVRILNGDTIQRLYVKKNITDLIAISNSGSTNTINSTNALTGIVEKDPQILITGYDKTFDTTNNNFEIVVKVEATFITKQGNQEATKIVETRYKITSPQYRKNISTPPTKIDIYPVFKGKIITSDGNLDISGTSATSTTITGDVWVKGNTSTINNPVYTFDKYRGGVSIKDETINLTGNIYSSQSVSLKDKANLDVSKDIYALNAYVGKENSGTTSTNNNLTIEGNLVVSNDLALNATNSTILIKDNFYGINDKTETTQGIITTADKALNSSSIIVNDITVNATTGKPSSTLTVEKNSYIMGVAYLNNDGDKYTTGESVAVKGNYLAYTHILPGYEGRVGLQYFNPLQLINKIDEYDTIDKKAAYFTKYFDNNKNSLKSGGVYLQGNVYSIGAYIQNGIANKNNIGNIYDLDTKKTNYIPIPDIESEKDSYSINVYAMGHATGHSTRTVVDQIDFTQPIPTTINRDFGDIVYNNISDNKIEISNGSIRVLNSLGGIIKTYPTNKAVVITNGQVTVKSGTNFTGNIIAVGDVKVEGDDVKLTYSESDTNNILAANWLIMKPIFNGIYADIEMLNKDVTLGINAIVTGTSQYDKSNYLETSNWKIIK